MEEGVYLLKLELENVRCFGEKAMLDLCDRNGNWKRWTVILGDNGTGKTTILKFISFLEQKMHQFPSIDKDLFEDAHIMQDPTVSNQKFVVPKILTEYQKIDELFKFGFVESKINVKTSLKSKNDEADILIRYDSGTIVSNRKTDQRYLELIIYGYGANRFMSRNSFTKSDSKNLSTLFDEDARLINAEEWLIELDYKAIKATQSSEEKGFLIKQRDLALQLLRNILPNEGVLDIRFTEPSRYGNSTIEFLTPYGWVTIHQLSLGYKTMVAWMVDLVARMFDRYPESDNPLAEPAIVLVDEIDLHMHPKWQRKIFDYLSERFPKTQFIVTAHSPLIVQSAPKDANIVLLRREGDHVVIDNDIKSVHNWRIDQILNSDLFGNISQRTPDIEDWMKEREELLFKENLETYEKKRLKELEDQADKIPTADNQRDIEAMEIIRKAADYLKTQTA